MANVTYNSESLMLREMTLQWGTSFDLDLMTANDDVEDFFTPSGVFGYLRMGTFKIGIKDSFVEYKSKTPHQIVREDMLERIITWEFTANQLEGSNFTLLYNALQEIGVFTHNKFGSDTPTRPRFAILGKGALVDGSPVKALAYSGSIVTEDITLNMSGTDYVDIPAMFQLFVAPEFAQDPSQFDFDQQCYMTLQTPGGSS